MLELAASLGRLRGEFEVIVCDGGSADATEETARQCGLRVIEAPRGRGPQMNAGARLAKGETLLFLHADTRLPEDAIALVADALADDRVCGGNFSLIFGGDTREARLLTRIYPFLRLGGMLYGDSAIFVRRRVFDLLNGYREYPIFEDCDLYRRMPPGKICAAERLRHDLFAAFRRTVHSHIRALVFDAGVVLARRESESSEPALQTAEMNRGQGIADCGLRIADL